MQMLLKSHKKAYKELLVQQFPDRSIYSPVQTTTMREFKTFVSFFDLYKNKTPVIPS